MAKEKNTNKDNNTKPELPTGSTLSRIEDFIQNNKKNISYIAGGIVFCILIILAYNKIIRQPKEQSAYEQMFRAEYYFSIDSLDLALHGDGNYPGFYEIVDDYRWTSAANLSHYYIGIILMKQRQFEDAITHLKKYKSKDEILSSMAQGAIGDAYVELGELDKALKHYLNAANKSPNQFTSPVFLTKAAWVYEQKNDYKKGIEMYEKIKKEFHGSFESQEADKYIAYLEAKLNKE